MKVSKITPSIFSVTFNNKKNLAETFVRFEEYFENPHFKGKVFSLKEFKKWYMQNTSKGKKTKSFDSYYEWEGFNIPSQILNPFYKGKFNPLSKKEKKLLKEFSIIHRKKIRFYIIGTLKNQNISILKHEIAHGLFYTNKNYKKEVLKILRNMNKKDKEKIKIFLKNIREYHSSVLEDETHAYLLDRRYLRNNKINTREIRLTSIKIKKLFNKYFKSN